MNQVETMSHKRSFDDLNTDVEPFKKIQKTLLLDSIYRELWEYVKRFGLKSILIEQLNYDFEEGWDKLILNYHEFISTPKKWFINMQYFSRGEDEVVDLCLHFEDHLQLLCDEKIIHDDMSDNMTKICLVRNNPSLLQAIEYIKSENPSVFEKEVLEFVKMHGIDQLLVKSLTTLCKKKGKLSKLQIEKALDVFCNVEEVQSLIEKYAVDKDDIHGDGKEDKKDD